ncbi:MAG: PH domain-containing protein [Sphingomonadaceae bacterium]
MSEATVIPLAEPRRTAPVGLLVKAVAGLRQSIAGIAALVFLMRDQGSIFWIALGVVLLVAAINVIVAGLQWHRLTFHVGDEDIRLESGVVARTARSVPYERIQDISLEQGPLARLLGLVEVRFETGAGGADDLSLTYLTVAEGEELRELVRARRDLAPVEPGEDAAAPPAAAPVLFAMGPRRVLTFGLFEFSLAVIAVLFGVTQQFDFLLPFDIWDFDRWEERLAGPGAQLAGLGAAVQVIGGMIAAASILLLGFATGVVRTALREWGFLLERTDKGFRRKRGLLTRTDVVMPVHRVQAMTMGTRLLRRLFGWHGLSFVSLAQDAGSANHVVAPFGKKDELWPVAQAAGFSPPPEDAHWHRASTAYRFDAMLLAVMLPVIAAAVVIGLGQFLWALLPLTIGAILVTGEWIAWRKTEHLLDERQVIARRGWLAPRLDIAPRVKLQSVDFRQGPLGRWHGYGTLHLGLAGGAFEIPGVPVERGRAVRDAVLASIAETDFSALNRD